MKQLTILVVEDDKLNRAILTAALQEDGHIVQTVTSIEECHDALKTSRPDTIILDRGLPAGDGLKLCLTLKKASPFNSIPTYAYREFGGHRQGPRLEVRRRQLRNQTVRY